MRAHLGDYEELEHQLRRVGDEGETRKTRNAMAKAKSQRLESDVY